MSTMYTFSFPFCLYDVIIWFQLLFVILLFCLNQNMYQPRGLNYFHSLVDFALFSFLTGWNSVSQIDAVKCGRIQVDGELVPVSYIVRSSQKISHFLHRYVEIASSIKAYSFTIGLIWLNLHLFPSGLPMIPLNLHLLSFLLVKAALQSLSKNCN